MGMSWRGADAAHLERAREARRTAGPTGGPTSPELETAGRIEVRKESSARSGWVTDEVTTKAMFGTVVRPLEGADDPVSRVFVRPVELTA